MPKSYINLREVDSDMFELDGVRYPRSRKGPSKFSLSVRISSRIINWKHGEDGERSAQDIADDIKTRPDRETVTNGLRSASAYLFSTRVGLRRIYTKGGDDIPQARNILNTILKLLK